MYMYMYIAIAIAAYSRPIKAIQSNFFYCYSKTVKFSKVPT